ncbi:MAG: hypothetical protein H7Y08_12860 [Rhizobiaceae bacterium]|nr:hypothetical protein [Rhizobiaceae bacterium]
MKRPAAIAILATLSAASLAGCTTPYPNGTPIAGATLDANRAPRGSAAFCETYARQSAGNAYETSSDDSTFGRNFIEAQRARAAGQRAYDRCLAGRTS